MAGRRLGSVATRQATELRASWVLDRWSVRPSLRYHEIRSEIMERYAIGQSQAAIVIARAYELVKESREKFVAEDGIAACYLSLFESAKRERNYGEARKILKDMKIHLGLGHAEKLELTGPGVTIAAGRVADLEDMSDEQIAALTELDRRAKAREAPSKDSKRVRAKKAAKAAAEAELVTAQESTASASVEIHDPAVDTPDDAADATAIDTAPDSGDSSTD